MVKEVSIVVPQTADDITLGQYQQFAKLQTELRDGKELNEFVKIRLVSIFCDVPVEVVKEFSIDDVDKVSAEVANVVSTIVLDKDEAITPIIEIEGVEFGFIPDMENMTAGEFADLSEYLNEFSDLNKVMAVLYRPIKHKFYNKYVGVDQYSLEPYNGTSEFSDIMKLMPVERAVRASFFLRSLAERLEGISQIYSQLETLKKKKSDQPSLWSRVKQMLSRKSGDGIKPSMS